MVIIMMMLVKRSSHVRKETDSHCYLYSGTPNEAWWLTLEAHFGYPFLYYRPRVLCFLSAT